MLKIKTFFSILVILGVTLTFSQSASAKSGDVKLRVFERYPSPGKPALISACTVTTNDNVKDYGVAGWQMPSEGVGFKINFQSKPKTLTNNQVQTAVAKSFATWHSADSDQIFTNTGVTTVKAAKLDGINAILFKRGNSSAIATTYVWYYPLTDELAEVDTVFNSQYQWSVTDPGAGDCGGKAGTYDLQNIGTHEFGHWVGLDDLYSSIDKDLTMFGYGDLQELKKDTLGTGDINGVQAILP